MNISENSPIISPVAIIGMHRSGTSLVARVLNLAGYSLGPEDDLLGISAHNQAGHWESQTALSINTDLLTRFGGDWNMPPILPHDWIETLRREPVWEDARRFVTTQASGGKPWAWKEPRTTLTLAFWRSVLQSLQMPDPYVIVCVRNPLDVAYSLTARDKMSLEQSLMLWHYYTDTALRQAPVSQRHIVFYEALMSDFSSTFAPVLDFLRISIEPSQFETLARSVNPKLQHHQHSTEDVFACDAMSDTAKQLYAALTEGADAIDAFLKRPPLSEQDQKVAFLQMKAWANETKIRQLQAILDTRSHRAVENLRNKFAQWPIFRKRRRS